MHHNTPRRQKRSLSQWVKQKLPLGSARRLLDRIPRGLRPVVVGGGGLVILLLPQQVGFVGVAAYALASWVYQIPSRKTFLAAFITLGFLPVAIIMQQKNIAQSLGAYSFLLFVVALISICSELIREAKAKQSA